MPSSLGGEVSLSRLSGYNTSNTMPVTSRLSYSTSSYSPRSSVYRGTSLDRGSYSPLGSSKSVYSTYSSSSSYSSAPSRPPLPSASTDYRRRYEVGTRSASSASASSRREAGTFDMDSLGKLTEARKYLMERRAANAAESPTSSPARPRYCRTESRDVRAPLELPSRSARGSISASTGNSRQPSVERVSERILNFESRSSSGYGSGSSATSGAASPATRRGERIVPITLDSDRRGSSTATVTESTERRPSVSELRRQFDSVMAASAAASASAASSSSDDDSSSTLSSSSQPGIPTKEPARKPTPVSEPARKAAPASEPAPAPAPAPPPPPPPPPPPAPAVKATTPVITETRVVGGRSAESERPASPAHKLTNGLSNGHGLTNGHHKERLGSDKDISSSITRQSALLSESPLRRQRTESSGSSTASTTTATERPPETGANVQYGPQDGLTGLRNIGNTCFMNSVLQCLSNTRALHDYILRDGFAADVNTTTSGMKGALIQAFVDLMQDLWKKSDETERVVTTAPFKNQIQRFAPRFMGYQQQDAQEFLRYLLEGLHEDVNRVTARPRPITEDIDDNLSDSQKAMESWKRFMRFDNSKFVDLFVGQLKSTLRCTVCGHASVTFDPFWDLSLPIPAKTGQVRLQACFDLFTKEEVLDGDEKPTCAKCQKRQKCTKSFAIQKFPRILVVHLKRFSPQERYRGKLNSVVDFPLCGLDLSSYSEGQGPCKYSLYGVANHSGTLYSGHYTAYCRHPYSAEWREYNDSRIRTVSMRSVVSKEAYVLFFELANASSL